MHRPRRKLASKTLILLGLAVVTGGFAAEARVLRIRSDSWMPFNGDPAGEKPGYVIEVLREIFEPQGVKIDYQIMPWTDSVKAVEAAQAEGIIGTDVTEAAKMLIGKVPIAEPIFSLFVRKDSPWKYQNIRSLKELRLGVVEGYNYWPSIDEYIKKSTAPAVHVYSGNAPAAEAVADLTSGKIDVMVESVLVFYWSLKSNGQKISDFRSAYSESTEPLYVAFAKTEQGREYTRMFDEGLVKLKASGRFDAILAKYGSTK